MPLTDKSTTYVKILACLSKVTIFFLFMEEFFYYFFLHFYTQIQIDTHERAKELSALKSWLQLILAKYDINGNYSSYIKATSTKLAIIIVRPSVNKLQHFVAMETVT